jgi:hypothetical protein
LGAICPAILIWRLCASRKNASWEKLYRGASPRVSWA